MKLRFWFANLVFLLAVTQGNSQCSILDPLDIIDLTPLTANLLIEGATNDDLSGDQDVVGVLLEFEHTQVGDLTIELTSPSGQSIVLIGPTGSFGNTSLTDWEVLFMPCGDAASPDPGFSGTWSNNQDWGNLGSYSGSYHPFSGCLENFDTGSINGNWNFQILDNTQFDQGKLLNATIFFFDPSGINCDLCSAVGGEFEVDDLFVCSNDNSNIELEPIFVDDEPGFENEYLYIIRQGDAILDVSPEVNFSGYAEGVYQVCGISVRADNVDDLQNIIDGGYAALVSEIEGQTPSICAAVTQTCVNATISQDNIEQDLNITICDGDDYELGGVSFGTAGTYEVIVPQNTGCDSIYNLILSLSNIEAVITPSSTTLDCADPNITLSSNQSTTSPNTVYNWYTMGGNIVGANDVPTININEAGTYFLELTDGLCVQTTSIQILKNAEAAEVEITGGTITCEEPEIDLDLESNISISSVSWDGPGSFSSTDEDITVNVSGVYTATVTSDNGCVTIKSITVNEAGETPILSLSADDLSCAAPLVTIQVLASSNSLSYSWTGPSGFEFDGKNPVVGIAGVYTVTAMDNFGCEETFEIEIFGDPDALEYSVLTEDILCPGAQVSLEVVIDNPNAFIQWDLPDGSLSFSNPLVTDQAGNYDVTIVSNECSKTETVTVAENISPIPVIQIVQDQPIGCQITSANLSFDVIANQDQIESFEWTSPQGQKFSDQIINVDLAGLYRLTVVTLDGCVVSENHALLYEAIVPDVDLTNQNVTCGFPEGFVVSVANESYNYEWVDLNGTITTDSIVTTTTANSYNLTVSDDNGCYKKFFINVAVDTISNKLNSKISNVLDCNNSSSVVTISSLPFTSFTWTDVNGDFISDNDTIEFADPGVYFVELVDRTSQCISIDSVEVIQDISTPDLEVENQSFDCGQESMLLVTETITPNVAFQWEGPNGFESSTKSPLITDAGDYTVTATGQNGCETIETITVDRDNALPNVEASFSNDLDCVNTQTTATGTTTTAGATFQWIGPNNVFDESEIVIEVAGEYVFIVTGSNACSDSIVLDIPFIGELPEFYALSDTLFCGENDLLIDVLEVTPDVTYEWNGPNGYTSTEVQNIVTEEGLYIITGISANSCVLVDTAFVVIDNLPANISLDQPIDTLTCAVTELNYSFSSDIALQDIQWMGPSGIMSSDPSISITEAGDYTLQVQAENECNSSLSFVIIEDVAEPIFSLENEDINCDNQKAEINMTVDDPLATFSWEGPSFTSDLQNVTVEASGNYSVTVTGENGCTDEQSVEVAEDLTPPDLVVVNDTLPCNEDPILLEAFSTTTDVVVQWLGPNGFDSTGINALTNIEGIYFVTATGPNGCSVTEEIEIFDVPVYPDVDISFSNDINCENDETEITAVVSGDIQSIEWTGEEGFVTDELIFMTGQGGKYVFEAIGENGCIQKDSIQVNIDTLYPAIVVEQLGKLLCDVNTIGISGEGSAQGVEYSYNWDTSDGKINFGGNSLNPVIEGEGTYTLYVKNNINGCQSEDSIAIKQEESTLESMDVDFVKQTCNDIDDAIISIQGVTGGFAPYRYAIEGGSFTENGKFEGLSSGEFLVSVKDSFGCVLDSIIILDAKNQVTVDLGDDKDVILGQSLTVTADFASFPIANISEILWEPSDIADCLFCTQFDFVPEGNMIVTVFVTDNNGCMAQDQMIVRVDDDIKLYIPNIFTPNDDGVNDFLIIPESPNVSMINSFRVYDRWGSKVFQEEGKVPGQLEAWDGRHLGQRVQNGVFLYVAEVEMVNGDVRILRGNITVVR